MDELNPYEPPKAVQTFGELAPTGEGDTWRDGPLLVFRRGGQLPDRCVRCNAPAAGGRFRRIIRSIPIDTGLCPKHRRLAWRAVLIPYIGGAYGAFLLWYLRESAWVPLGLGVMILGLVLGPLKLAWRTVTIARLDPDFLWLKGVHPDFLDELRDVRSS
jgi:hypothetical protein